MPNYREIRTEMRQAEKQQQVQAAAETRQTAEQMTQEDNRRADDHRQEDRIKEDDKRREEERRRKKRKKYLVGGKSNDIATLAIQDAIGLVGGIAKDGVYIGKTIKSMFEGKKENTKQPQLEHSPQKKESPAMQRYKEHEKALSSKVQARIVAQKKSKTPGRER